ncbi:uncharacterized protein (DUF1697 family) [Inquilinus ginsengisoli]|uniref:DUF1697 domain-containing protein n=1 Tax=Inquilinus ginsengisoli TaxID=363840 RepID=UPI003D22035C
MTTWIALLRAVNLAGHAPIRMADLRALAAEIGLAEPRTLLQSGNLVFEGKGPAGALERTLEEALKQHLGLGTEVFVRSAADWAGLIARNPFPEEAESDPSHLVLLPLKQAPKAVAALQAGIVGREQVRTDGRHAYITYPDGIGRSKLTMAAIEKKLGTSGTGRNWNTVLKLAALARG